MIPEPRSRVFFGFRYSDALCSQLQALCVSSRRLHDVYEAEAAFVCMPSNSYHRLPHLPPPSSTFLLTSNTIHNNCRALLLSPAVCYTGLVKDKNGLFQLVPLLDSLRKATIGALTLAKIVISALFGAFWRYLFFAHNVAENVRAAALPM